MKLRVLKALNHTRNARLDANGGIGEQTQQAGDPAGTATAFDGIVRDAEQQVTNLMITKNTNQEFPFEQDSHDICVDSGQRIIDGLASYRTAGRVVAATVRSMEFFSVSVSDSTKGLKSFSSTLRWFSHLIIRSGTAK